MKYTLKNTTFSALAALFFVASAFCMEDESKILISTENPTELLFFLESIHYWDHGMICKIGRLNTEFYQAIKKAAFERKQYIEKNMQLKPDNLSQIMWHSYGSAYGFIEPKEERSFGLSTCWVVLNQVSLDYNKGIKHNKLSSEQTLLPLSPLKHGKWNENGTMNFYWIRECENAPEVRELSSFSENDVLHSKYCVVSFSDSSGFCGSLYTLRSLPNLFRAFIHSSVISDDDRDPANLCKIFDLQGVTIPTGFDEDLFFYQLPPNWKKAITDRYGQQSKK